MTPQPVGLARRLIPAFFVLALVGTFFAVARLPSASAEDRAAIAGRFAFTELPIALPPGLPERSVREVNPAYEHIQSWISSVGAAMSVNDLDGRGGSNDLCLVDTRSDAAIVTPAPDSGADYAPFVLDPAPLPMGDAIAPMGCTPGDFNLDGRMDLLVYYWGRTPVLFMQRPGVTSLSLAAYRPVELIPQAQATAEYRGPLWNTNAVAVADFDGDGRPDIGVFNYFPDTQVLDPRGHVNVQMNHSMSHATNAGGAHILRWTSATSGDAPSATYEEQVGIDPRYSTGWTLGAGSADLDGDLLPELYVANDFGRDRFFHNRSTPGEIRFELAEGHRGPLTPKSLVVGHDSFKGMSIDFADLEGEGRFDMFVSNITVSWGLEESNFVWRNTAATPAEARSKLTAGVAPFDNVAAEKNLAWVGWGWDAKMADFDNSGGLEVVQAVGFVKGDINRFNWLQELAMANDLILREPQMWPKAEPGDDIAGSNPLAFWVREDNGRYVNLSPELGLADETPTRGVAVADTNGDGAQDFAVARQWGPPAYFRNGNGGDGDFLGLRLHRPLLADGTAATAPTSADPAALSPAYGAQVRVTTADGRTQLAQLDGGSGHSGKRSFDVFFGLGAAGDRPVAAELSWRDLDGEPHRQTLDLTAGWHDLVLTDQARELTTR
ncbi:CRTAC1 family protein [Plantactinospora sp. GCM10030261]|uniref:CRTAC1 family protein n=1 Tax=Plantactinospora sp. GCM10030261 TaxID=3273420 RepID=UPI00361B280D